MISQEVIKSSILAKPNGATIVVLERYIVDKEVAAGYQHVYTPPIASVIFIKLQVTGITTRKICSNNGHGRW